MCVREICDIPSVELSMRMFIHACADFPLSQPPIVFSSYFLFTAQVNGYLLRAKLWPVQEAQPVTNALSEDNSVCVGWFIVRMEGGRKGYCNRESRELHFFELIE